MWYLTDVMEVAFARAMKLSVLSPPPYSVFYSEYLSGGGWGAGVDQTSPEGRPLLAHVVPLRKLEKENCLGTHRSESGFSPHSASRPGSAASAQLQAGTGSHAAETGHLRLLAAGRGCLLSAAELLPHILNGPAFKCELLL